jgi:geranylgeranyl diphosphate synthase type II
MANKKTFLLIHALETVSEQQKQHLQELLNGETKNKVQDTMQIFKETKVDEWAKELKEKYISEAFTHLEDIAVLSKRKEPLKQLALFLVKRES